MTQTPTARIQLAGKAGLLCLCLLSLGACSDLTPTQQRVVTGAAIGTAVGAATIAVTGGCVSCGAALGGAVGAGGGYLYDYVGRQMP